MVLYGCFRKHYFRGKSVDINIHFKRKGLTQEGYGTLLIGSWDVQWCNIYLLIITSVFGLYCKLQILVFFHRFMAQARSARAINPWKKRGSVICITDQKNEANNLFIIFLFRGPETSAEQAIWQSFDRRLFKVCIGSKNACCLKVTKIKMLMRYVEKVNSVKTKS